MPPAASPPPATPPADSVPEGYVRLNLLYEEEESPFYLQIPLDIIASLCLKPRKYLRFLGWCILGIKGDLAVEDDDDGLERISIEKTKEHTIMLLPTTVALHLCAQTRKTLISC
jgi:hypothetical protein